MSYALAASPLTAHRIKRANRRGLGTNTQCSQIAFSVIYALSLAPLGTKVLGRSTHFLIGSPVTLAGRPAFLGYRRAREKSFLTIGGARQRKRRRVIARKREKEGKREGETEAESMYIHVYKHV